MDGIPESEAYTYSNSYLNVEYERKCEITNGCTVAISERLF